MKSPNYSFWKMAFDFGWVDAELLKGAVVKETNPYGEITAQEYQEITGVPHFS